MQPCRSWAQEVVEEGLGIGRAPAAGIDVRRGGRGRHGGRRDVGRRGNLGLVARGEQALQHLAEVGLLRGVRALLLRRAAAVAGRAALALALALGRGRDRAAAGARVVDAGVGRVGGRDAGLVGAEEGAAALEEAGALLLLAPEGVRVLEVAALRGGEVDLQDVAV